MRTGLLWAACSLITLFASAAAYAQSPQPTGQIHGRVVDAKEQQPVVGTTILLTLKSDSTQQRVTISGVDGKFGITRIPVGDYNLRFSFIGFKTIFRDISIGRDSINLGPVMIEEDVQMLKEVVIDGVQMRAEQKGDTVIYNAEAFKVNPDATVEDLVKKMPGVTVENGEVKAQGETIRRVLVDGQEFLGDDAAAALKNLPAEIVARVQVFDRQSDQAQFTGFDDGNSERTLNILTKGGVNNAQFGKIYSGIGADGTSAQNERYNAGANLTWTDGPQRVTLIGSSNNMNLSNLSATDLLGTGDSGGGGGRGGMEIMGGGGGFGGGGFGGFGGGQGGVSTTHTMTVDYANRFSQKLNINGGYRFRGSTNNNLRSLNRSYFGSDDAFSQLYSETAQSRTINSNHNANMRITWTLDRKNSFIITPSISTQYNRSNRSNIGTTVLPDGVSKLNSTDNLTTSKNNALSFRNNLLYRRNFDKRGRTFSVSVNTNINDRTGQGTQNSFNEFLRSGSASGDMITQRIDQISDSPSLNTNWQGSVNYTEPLGARSQIQLNYSPSINFSGSERYTYNLDPITQFYTAIDSVLSNEFDNSNYTQRGGVSYRYNHGKLNFNIGANIQNQRLISEQSFPVDFYGKSSFSSVIPDAVLQYRFQPNSQFRLQYRAFTRTPSIQQLQNVIDNSNPLQLSMGNPNLGQQYTHNANLNYRLTRIAEGQTFFVMLNGSVTTDYLGNSTFIASRDTLLADGVLLRTGAQLRQPQNLGSSQSMRSFATYGLPFKALRSNLNLNVGGSLTRTPSVLNNRTYFTNNAAVNSGVVISSTISPQVDFTLSYNVNLSNVSYEQPNQEDSRFTTQRGSFQFSWMPWNKLVFITDFSYNGYDGLGDDLDQSIAVLNAAIGYKFLKKNAGEIRLTGFDLFNQNNSINRNITDTYIEDSITDVLTRYFVVTFTYNLRNFSTGPAPERDRFPGGGPGGWGGPGRPGGFP